MKKNARKKWERPRVEEVKVGKQSAVHTACDKTSQRRPESGGWIIDCDSNFSS